MIGSIQFVFTTEAIEEPEAPKIEEGFEGKESIVDRIFALFKLE